MTANQKTCSFVTIILNSIALCLSVYLNFDDNSRDWALLLNGSSGWELSHGCAETAGTGPCDDVSGGGNRHFSYFFLFFFFLWLFIPSNQQLQYALDVFIGLIIRSLSKPQQLRQRKRHKTRFNEENKYCERLF